MGMSVPAILVGSPLPPPFDEVIHVLWSGNAIGNSILGKRRW